MNLSRLVSRLDSIERDRGCPFCQAIRAMTGKERENRIRAIVAGIPRPPLPAPSPTCARCHQDPEAVRDRLAKLDPVLQEVLSEETEDVETSA
jgi:hypothetical protein